MYFYVSNFGFLRLARHRGRRTGHTDGTGGDILVEQSDKGWVLSVDRTRRLRQIRVGVKVYFGNAYGSRAYAHAPDEQRRRGVTGTGDVGRQKWIIAYGFFVGIWAWGRGISGMGARRDGGRFTPFFFFFFFHPPFSHTRIKI